MTGPGTKGATERTRVVVSGLVQGVFFRDSCRWEAGRHGVAGWVRNTPDGTVEAVFEGPAEAVTAMVRWAHRGPPDAVVHDVRAIQEQPEGLRDFTVS